MASPTAAASRDCVFIPTTEDDEMEAEWSNRTSLKHKQAIHDGEMTQSPDDVNKLFREMADSAGKNVISGQCVQLALPAASGCSGSSRMASTAAIGGGAPPTTDDDAADGKSKKAENEESSDEAGAHSDGDGLCADLLGQVNAAAAAPPAQRGASKADRARVAASAPSARTLPTTSSGKAKVKATAKISNAPPPLTKAAAAGRKTAAVAPDLLAPDRAEKDSKAQMAKLDAWQTDFQMMQRASIIAMDKKVYKSMKQLTDSLASKRALLCKDTALEITQRLKINDVSVKVQKAFKVWSKKGDIDEFMLEFTTAEDFANTIPSVTVQYPPCIQQSILEMKFARNLAETLKANDRDEIAKRYMLLSDPKLEGILTTDEVTKWQQDRADLSKTQATLLPHRARAPSLPQYTQMR